MTRENYKSHFIIYDNVRIEIRYCPAWLSSGIDGYNTAHLEIEAVEPERVRLPMTETGYRSHFCQRADVEAFDGPVGFVEAWLAETEKSREWQAYKAASRQLDLF